MEKPVYTHLQGKKPEDEKLRRLMLEKTLSHLPKPPYMKYQFMNNYSFTFIVNEDVPYIGYRQKENKQLIQRIKKIYSPALFKNWVTSIQAMIKRGT